jgi:hypothetical protein
MNLEEIVLRLKTKEVVEDAHFDQLYPDSFLKIADRHFSAVYVCQLASDFLCDQKHSKILDIGSGSGKFCLIGAIGNPKCLFTGVEYRLTLHRQSVSLKNRFNLPNCNFIHGNVLEIPLGDFNGFYMFNPFLEQKDKTAIIPMDYVQQNETDYLEYVLDAMHRLPKGTKLATYYIDKKRIPNSFSLVKSQVGNQLHFFVKMI